MALTTEERYKRKGKLIKYLSQAYDDYNLQIDAIDSVLYQIDELPLNTSYIYTDMEGNKYLKGIITIGTKDITGEYLGEEHIITEEFNISLNSLQAKKIQLIKEQEETLLHYQTLMSPEILPQFDAILDPRPKTE